MTRDRLFDGAQRRFQAHDRRWRLIRETQRGSLKRMGDWACAYLRWKEAAERAPLEQPRLTVVGSMLRLLDYVPRHHD